MYDLEEVKIYNQDTTIEGILINNESDFLKKLDLAISLWPQKNEEGIRYLFGRGVGVELALQGEVVGRKKRDINYDLRSHSDFEIYNAVVDDYHQLEDSKNFVYVFGSQEIYPRTKTKALKNIPEDLMSKTYDTVLLNGKSFLIPELELLFLDKFLIKECTPRKEGFDAGILMQQYDLDLNKILFYYNQYYLIPMLKSKEELNDGIVDKQVASLSRLAAFTAETTLPGEDIEPSTENIVKFINDKIKEFPEGTGVIYCGVRSNIYVIDPPFKRLENGEYYIDDKGYKKKILDRVNMRKNIEYQQYMDIQQEIINLKNKTVQISK